MDIISAYREAGTFRGAAAISGTTPKTVRRSVPDTGQLPKLASKPCSGASSLVIGLTRRF
jgi:hypothetical protein